MIWPHFGEPVGEAEFTMFRGLMVGSVIDGSARSIDASRRVQPQELGLCPSGRHAWIRTRAETVQVWDLDTGEQREYTSHPASVLQCAAFDSAPPTCALS